MINLQDIKKNYPYPDGFDRSALREYFQYKILDILFKNGLSDKISFLGGTAIKICYDSRRYSEDLDFDNFGLTAADFADMSEVIRRDLTLEGYEVETKNILKTVFRCYIKIPRVLFENKISPLENEKINIQIDTLPHDFDFVSETFLLQKYDVFRNIKVTPKDIILSQKAAAILGRKRAKGRDFYDFVYLRGITDFNYDYLRMKLNISTAGELKTALLKVCAELDFPALVRDVSPFLINQEEKAYIMDFRQYIEQKL
jgi:predicted nucleotidyltransferase component of viral defense system